MKKNHDAPIYLSNVPSSPSGSMEWEDAKDYFKNKAEIKLETIIRNSTDVKAFIMNPRKAAIILLLSRWLYSEGIRNINVACPVDVTITDGNGNVIAQFEKHQEAYINTEIGLGFSEENVDFLCIPQSIDYQVAIMALDNGTMTIQTMVMDEDFSVTDKKNVEEVSITKGTRYLMLYHSGMNLEEMELFTEIVYTLPVGLQVIESEAFAGVPATTIIIPASCTAVADDAFEGCPYLTKIIIAPPT